MLQEILEKVIVIVAGKQAEQLAFLLNNKKHVNEFIIAKKMDLTINQTRNLLYKISDQGLVSFIRKKDKKKGWYTYFWKIEVLKSLEFLKNILLNRIHQLEYQIKSRETKRFYICERCSIEFSEENALLHNFTCNECGDIFVMKDNTKFLRELNKTLDRLNRELNGVNAEIDVEEQKIEKQKIRELKKEEKAKAKKKEEKKLARKTAKKISKKVSAKKVVKKKRVKTKKVSKKNIVKKKASKKSKSKAKKK